MGIWLAERFMPDLPGIFHRVFVFGCVQPDYNYGSYLKGWRHSGNRGKGHSSEHALRYIRKKTIFFYHRKKWFLRDYYRFGKMLHYMADAFTAPHNDRFEGTLSDHIRYETEMHQVLEEFLSENRQDRCPVPEGRCPAADSGCSALCCRKERDPGGFTDCGPGCRIVTEFSVSAEDMTELFLSLHREYCAGLQKPERDCEMILRTSCLAFRFFQPAKKR